MTHNEMVRKMVENLMICNNIRVGKAKTLVGNSINVTSTSVDNYMKGKPININTEKSIREAYEGVSRTRDGWNALEEMCNSGFSSGLKLNDTVIFEIKYVWQDVIDCLDEEVREKYNHLSETEKGNLADYYRHDIGKGLKSSINYDWVTIIETCIEDSGLDAAIKEIENGRK